MGNLRSASQKPDSSLAPGCCSIGPPSDIIGLPLHELDNQPETPGPMSVLEWRRAVWFQVQSIHHEANHQDSSDIKSEITCRRSHSWMLKDSSTNSDSGDELLDGSNIRRPLPISSHQTTGRKPITVPLIDLSQPTDADGRPIQFEDGRAKLVAQSNKPKKQMMAAPDIEQRHREAMRRLQAEATEQLIYAEWEAAHQRSTSHFHSSKLHRLPSKRAPLQKLSDFARRSVSNFSVRTNVIESPARTVGSGTNGNEHSRVLVSKSSLPHNEKTPTKLVRMIKKIGTIKRYSKNKKVFSPDSEASISRKSLLSSFQFSSSSPALHP